MNEASYYSKLENHQVQCLLCPRNCIIEEGKFGDCHARRNRNGVLSSEVYAKIAAMNTDPIEKKPLYHFFPGSQITSIGTTGCNLHCNFCQNHTLSQINNRKPAIPTKTIQPEQMSEIVAKSSESIGLAYTYNEPTINYEYMLETARLVKQNGKHTAIISNGYVNPDPLHMLLEYIDAFNIDLKGFTNNFYKKHSKATLKPVLKTIKEIAKSGKHIEITNLIIPQANSDEEEFDDMCKWIATETGKDTPLHLSRYFPRYESNQYPTPPELLFNLYDIARSRLNFVYLGNIATELHSNTICPTCGKTVVKRTYYHIDKKGLTSDGKCKNCGTEIFKNL
jgi:pyruvate formate lyase activating enzyme